MKEFEFRGSRVRVYSKTKTIKNKNSVVKRTTVWFDGMSAALESVQISGQLITAMSLLSITLEHYFVPGALLLLPAHLSDTFPKVKNQIFKTTKFKIKK